MKAAITKDGRKGLIIEYGTQHTGRKVALVQLNLGGELEWFKASDVRVYLSAVGRK